MSERIPSAPSSVPNPPRADGTVKLAIALIAVGVAFLFMRLVPSVSWWNTWPLLIVILGVIQALTPGRQGWSLPRAFDGLVVIALGGALLAMTTGMVREDAWITVIGLWPVLLVAAGLDLLGKALNSSWLRVAGSLAIIVALAYSVTTTFRDIDDVYLGQSGQVSVSEPVDTIEEARFTLDSGVAAVRVRSGSDLVEILGASSLAEPSIEVRRDGRVADVSARIGGPGFTESWRDGCVGRYEVALSDKVVWDVRMNTGVASLTADFSGIPIRELDLRPGLALCDIRLGDVPAGQREARAEVRSGISSVTLRIPKGAAARLEIESGISDSKVRGGFKSRGSGVWETSSYQRARDRGHPVWVIRVRAGICSITIDTY